MKHVLFIVGYLPIMSEPVSVCGYPQISELVDIIVISHLLLDV